jgi:protein toll
VLRSVADRDWVISELQPELEDGPEKYRLCLHERDFKLGSIIANNIVECMRNSRTTLVVLSPHFVRSQVGIEHTNRLHVSVYML